MMSKKVMMIVCLTLISLTLIAAEQIELTNRYSYNLYPYVPAVNVTINATTNNSIYWDGNAYSDTRWLDLNGGNANQDIDIGIYDMFANAFYGDGSGLTGIVFNYPHDQELNTTDNVRFNNLNVTNHIEVHTINGTNATFHNVNITKNSTLYIGGIALSTQDTFEGKRVLSITDNETGDDVFVDAFAYLGSGFYLTNISFSNGTVFALNFNATGEYYGGNYTGNNATMENFFGGNFYGDFFGTYDWTAQSPFLSFNGSFLSFNSSLLNASVAAIVNNTLDNYDFDSITLNGSEIDSWADVNYTVGADSVTVLTGVQTGSYSVVVPNVFDFEITRLIVTPTNTANSDKYRFAVYEVTGEIIEKDIILHSGIWNIEKSYAIDNNQITLNFTDISPSNSFSIEIKYLRNVN